MCYLNFDRACESGFTHVPECSKLFLFMGWCKISWLISWCNWCLLWGFWPKVLHIWWMRCLTIYPRFYRFWIYLCQEELYRKPRSEVVVAKFLVWEAGAFFPEGQCPWSQIIDCHLRFDCHPVVFQTHCFHWGVVWCPWVLFQSQSDAVPFLYRAETFAWTPLGHCCVLYPSFLYSEGGGGPCMQSGYNRFHV